MLVSRIGVGNARNPAAAMDGANTGFDKQWPTGCRCEVRVEGTLLDYSLLLRKTQESEQSEGLNLQHEGARI